MAKTPKRLAGPSHLAATAADLYTVPASTKTIVRHIHFCNNTAQAQTCSMSIGTDAAAVRIFDTFNIPANGVYDHYCYHVLEAAQKIQGFAGAGTSVTVTINGDELTLG